MSVRGPSGGLKPPRNSFKLKGTLRLQLTVSNSTCPIRMPYKTKEKRQEHEQKPETKKRRQEREQKPENKKKQQERAQKPENKKKQQERKQKPAGNTCSRILGPWQVCSSRPNPPQPAPSFLSNGPDPLPPKVLPFVTCTALVQPHSSLNSHLCPNFDPCFEANPQTHAHKPSA